MHKQWNWALLACLGMAGAASLSLPLAAQAQNVRGVRAQSESSMLLRGEVRIAADGSVQSFTLHQRDAVVPGVAQLVENSVPQWRFQPVTIDGVAVAVTAPVSLRVVGRMLEDGKAQVSITSASFRQYRPDDASMVHAAQMTPPSFPRSAAAVGAAGDVLVLLKIGRDGTVQDAIAEQVNMRVVATARQMDVMRNDFARAALATARGWRFTPPSAGAARDEPFWVLRVPVRFRQHGSAAEAYGQWSPYVPGPRVRADWQNRGDDIAAQEGDALPDGGAYLADAGNSPRLLTRL